MSRACVCAVIGLLVLAPFEEVLASSSGDFDGTLRPGDVGNGCGGCHGSAGGVSTQSTGPEALLPGVTVEYLITVSEIQIANAEVGFTAAITNDASHQPVFSVVSGEPARTGDSGTQITHTNESQALKLPQDGAASYAVNLTMPNDTPLGTSYTLYAVGDAGKNATQDGWAHAASLAIRAAPPVPLSITADQGSATESEIPLSWSGSQGEHFRVLARPGAEPSGPADPDAILVYEGSAESAKATGLASDTTYFFSAWGKAPSADYYSSEAARASAYTLSSDPGFIFADRFETTNISR
ncbi:MULTISPECIES: choice-of-anchor V domain-containing protein [unclassified Wenzhouxiangella]|uniref:choice-of-anchor V domain-containing protein n=1 Tax=unclassified Wenzhouxiangella TaxID=2613841 RepID=UPI0015F27C51|nr:MULTISPECIES: choice-of-anchor V domain-containing protein [unclassified Wenzhouxiangella]